MRKIVPLLLFLAIMTFAQNRETRAVWVATNFRLDWPPPVYDEIEQKLALDEIFKTIREKNFNAVYFQVVAKATAFYRSAILPSSLYLAEADEEPSYDALQYAISLARHYGLEIHAWINTARVFSGDEYEFLQLPKHVVNTHPDWIVTYGKGRAKSYWLNFGIPEAREFMISVATEIARNYDIDGIQFDFLRYPGKNFQDSVTFSSVSDSVSLDDWRRENINTFIRVAYDSIKSINRLIKVGAAPFGIYKNIPGAEGAQSFSFVYQDSRKWLKNGWVDYLVPQIYWDIETNPRFDSLAYDWTKNTFGRNVVLGVAAYKRAVLTKKKQIIKIMRNAGAAGIAFFRYGFIKNVEFPEFEKFVYPKEMPWLDSASPAPPKNFIARAIDDGFVEFRWENTASDVKYFSLYDVTFEPNLIALLPSAANFARMKINVPKAVITKFEMRAVDKLWNESKPSQTAFVELPELARLINLNDIAPQKPTLIRQGEKYFLVIFSAYNNEPQNARIVSGETTKNIEVENGINFIELKNVSGKVKLFFNRKRYVFKVR